MDVLTTLALALALALWTVNLGAQWAGIEGGAINWLALSTHVQPLLRGLVSTADLIWFALAIGLMLTLAVRRVVAEPERG
jgi:ABC-2 type transport system permease protein